MMVMIKSSWRILIFVILSYNSIIISLVSGQKSVVQSKEINGVLLQDPYNNQYEPKGTIQNFPKMVNGESPQDMMRYSVESQLIGLISQVSDQLKAYDDFKRAAANAVRPKLKNQRISAKQEVENLETVGPIRANRFNTNLFNTNDPGFERLSQKVVDIMEKIPKINKTMSQIVLTDRQQNSVLNNVIFNLKSNANKVMRIISGSTNIPSLQTDRLLDNLVYRRLKSSHQISGPIRLTRRSLVNKMFTKTTNDLNLIRDVVLKGLSPVVVKTPLNIAILKSDSISIRLPNPMDDLIHIKSSTPVAIPSSYNTSLIFDSIVANDLDVAFISAESLESFKSSALTYSSDQLIPKSMTINSIRTPEFTLRDTINGLNFNHQVVRLLHTNSPIKVARLTINSKLLKASNLNVSILNNQRFPDDYLLANSPQIIPSSILGQFTNSVKFSRGVEINGFMNRFRYPDDFVTLDGDEKVFSNLTFTSSITLKDGIKFNRALNEDTYIGKHRVSDLVNWIAKPSLVTRQLKDNPSDFLTVKGDLGVTSTINGIQLNNLLLNDLVHLSESKIVPVTGFKRFVNPIDVPSIAIREINHLPLKDIASTKNPIKSPVRFISPVVINNLIWNSTKDGNRLLDLLNKRISLTHPGTMNGDVRIENMIVDSLSIDSSRGLTINNLNPQQLVFSGNHQHVSAPLTINGEVIFNGSIWTSELEIGRTLNNHNANRLMEKSVNHQKRQNFALDRLILRNCRVYSLIPNTGDWKFRNRLVVHTLRNLLQKDGDQIISSRKRFLSTISFRSNIASRSTRGALLGLQKGPLFTRSSLTIKQKLRLSQLVITGDLKINGKLNGIDFSAPLTNLQNQQKDFYSMISSQSFYAGLKAASVFVNFINGKPFDSYWSKLKVPQFNVPVSLDRLIVDGHVYLNGLLNNLPIANLINSIRNQLRSRAITLYGDVILRSPVTSYGNLNVSGKINGIDFNRLSWSLSQLSKMQKLTGTKTFKSIRIGGNLIVKQLNMLQLKDFLHNIVLIHPKKALMFGGPVQFTSAIKIRENINFDRLRSQFTINSRVNGINIRALLDNQQQQFRPSKSMETATIIFNDPVFIRSRYPIQIMGKVNNLDLTRDVIWLTNHFQPSQYISGRKTFKRANFKSDLTIGSTLNGIDWTDRLKKKIHLRAAQNITESLKFGGKMIFSSGLSVSMLDSIPVSSLIVTINQPNRNLITRVPARWTFAGRSLVVRKDLIVDGRIGNVSLSELVTYSMKKHVPQTINVSLKFDHLILKSIDPVSSMFTDLQSAQKIHSSRWNQIASRLDNLDRAILSNGPIYSKLVRYIEQAPIEIKGFQKMLTLPGVTGSTIDCQSVLTTSSRASNYLISIGSTVDDNIIATDLLYNGTQSISYQKINKITSYITIHNVKLDSIGYKLLQASPNSTNPSILINDRKQLIGQLNGHAYDDLHILSISGRNKFIVALSSVRGIVETFTLGIVNGRPLMTLINTLEVTPNARKISLFMMMNQIYLAVARNSDSECESENSSSLLFHWNEREYKLIQRFNHFEATNVVHYHLNGHSYLVFSESKGKVDRLTDNAIHVYQSIFKKWPYCQFNHFYSIDFEHAIDLQVINFPSPSRPIQLLAAINLSTLTIWQQKGSAGFTQIWSTSLNDGQAFKFFILNNNLYIIVAQASHKFGSFILKASFNHQKFF